MHITTVLFDLDGTLLPMDQDEFLKVYFGLLVQKMAPHGYEARQLIDAVWTGTAAMVGNDGRRSNEEVFWECFARIYAERAERDKPLFDVFYRDDFAQAQAACGYNPLVPECLRLLHERGLRAALATNPIFPAVATRQRIRWAGLQPEDFELWTTYENSSYCKPNLKYYSQVLEKLQVTPQECLMVGNDVTEDMVAESLGMQVFLLTDCLINREQRDISAYQQGSFAQLMALIEQLD